MMTTLTIRQEHGAQGREKGSSLALVLKITLQSGRDNQAKQKYGSSEGNYNSLNYLIFTAISWPHIRFADRERNREHAKKSRVRKKMMLDTLADQLTALRDENVNLRRVVAERIPHLAPKILNDCTTVESGLLSSTSELNFASRSSAAQQPRQYAKILMEPDFRLIQALLHSQQNFVLSDPSLPDNPIVYASDGFCKLSGYKRQDILGRNCRFLQGPGTDPKAVDMIRKGISEGRDISVCLLNYRADGTPFWNQFFVAALRDAEGNVVNFVGIQCAVNSLPVSDIKERVKKLPIPVGI